MKNFMKILFLSLIVTAIALVAIYHKPILNTLKGGESVQEKSIYYCPMHPTYTSDKPGECPICHMKLVKREDEPIKQERSSVARKDMPGYAPVMLSSEKQQLIGVKLSTVKKEKLIKRVRSVGRVMVDETRRVHVHPKVEGWVDEIYAKYEGDVVKKGEPLFSFYSPDFVSAQEEYLIALQAKSNVESARKRLLLWDISEEQIKNLEERGVSQKNLILASPIDGIVLKKNIFQGEYMERGGDFFHLVDLSTLWVDVDLYEHDLPWVKVGEEASLSLPQDSSKIFRGKVIFISPTLKAETRTAIARLQLPNPDNFLRPEMYVDAQIEVDLGERLIAPTSALMDTGARTLVFVKRDKGIFEPREVDLGVRAGDLVEVVKGLKEGDEVVTSGNFLIDSESRLKGAIEGDHHGH